MASIISELFSNIIELTRLVTDVALSDPFAALLVFSSTVIWLVAFGLFGYLALGGLLSPLIPESIGRTPPQQGE